MELRSLSATSIWSRSKIAGVKTGLCDVSRREDIVRMIAECTQALGGLDVLVNNAGISGPTAPVEEME